MKRAPTGLSGQHEAIQKQLEYLYPKVLNALGNPVRLKILELLAQKSGERLAFSELKAIFPKLGNASLAHHLRLLQMADLVARTVRLEERRKNPNPYYCFYSITPFGERIMRGFRAEMEKAIEMTFKG